MHDPRSKNRFSKLSYVERTAAALSARWQTICSLPFSLLSSRSFTFYTRAGNGKSVLRPHPVRGKGANIPFRGICPFHLPRDIFGSDRTNRKATGSYIAFILRDELRRRSSSRPDPPPTKLPQLFPLTGTESVFRLNFQPENSFRTQTRCPRKPSSFSVIPIPIPFLYAYCHSSHCASYERRTKVSNELLDRKLSSVWSAN